LSQGVPDGQAEKLNEEILKSQHIILIHGLFGWGSGDLVIEKWRENDGAVSSISQRYPFTAGNHPVGGEGIFGRNHIERGKWYYEKVEESTGRSFDHLDVGFGCFTDPSLIGAQKKLYRNIFSLLGELS
jgi:triacylglycerol lipase